MISFEIFIVNKTLNILYRVFSPDRRNKGTYDEWMNEEFYF